MFKFLEKWALKRLLKRISKDIPNIETVWEKHYEEIERKVADAIKTVLVGITKKALERAKDKIYNASNN